jgi:undecaprenyl diphosphate synthase
MTVTELAELRVPRHIAIIMDGNGRWAKARGLPRTDGHRRGIDAVKRTLEASGALGVEYLTLFGFSSENWKRPTGEVDDLMWLLRRFLQSETARMHENNIRIRVIGDRSTFSPDIVRLIEHSEQMTSENDGLHLTAALSYGGRQEIVTAARALAQDVLSGRVSPEDIDDDRFASYLATAKESAISCCGRLPTPSWCSATFYGPISTANTSNRPSRNSTAAKEGLVLSPVNAQ